MTARRAAWLAGAAMLLVYLSTLAPSVTFWDAGEFIAAAKTLGIPHPPGTPLYVLLLNAWARLLWFLPFAAATNLFSAVCAAAAVGMTARWLTRDGGAAIAAVTAGAMTSAWQNATETEVYSASLALAIASIVAADLAARTTDAARARRWLVLASYLVMLAVPLHASALVAAPVVVYVGARRIDGTIDWNAGGLLAGASVVAIAIGRLSPVLIGVGLLLMLAAGLVRKRPTVVDRGTMLAATVAVVVAVSGLLFLLIRARFDPAINQGNPESWSQLAQAIGRRQYDLPGLWPRRAPLWLQLANWFEFADWQFALSLGPTVIPTIARMAATAVYVVLGVVGFQALRRQNRRLWIATAILFVCGSLGVIVYLNLKAGASFAWNFVPADTAHEARERDYFFVLGFWAWGIWAGLGALAAAERYRLPRAAGVGLAVLPIALNWQPMNRRSELEASMPRMVASTLLDNLPRNAVLLVNGDNDTYPLWYAQQVEGLRHDVLVVTIPLLVAPWYAAELSRRDSLTVGSPAVSAMQRAKQVADGAAKQGRPVAIALTVDVRDRNQLNRSWKVIGLSAVAMPPTDSADAARIGAEQGVAVDSAESKRVAAAVENWRRGRGVREAVDPVHEYFLRMLSCPSYAVEKNPSTPQLASLDSLCNHR